jgi:hypothetical protein
MQTYVPNDWFTVPYFRNYSRWNTNRNYPVAPPPPPPPPPLLMVTGVGKNAILTSKDDGKTWTASKSANSVFKIANIGEDGIGVVSGAIHVAWNGSIWVAAGLGKNAIATSKDGTTWTASKSANSVFKVEYDTVLPFTAAECSGVAWNGSLWVAASTLGKNAIGTSKDGITWTASKSANSLFKIPGADVSGAIDVAWNGKLWVAVGIGKNTIATSKDGKTWKASKNSIFKKYGPTKYDGCLGVAWNGSFWVAVGSVLNTDEVQQSKGKLATSKDGITWTLSKTEKTELYVSVQSNVSNYPPY